MYFGGDLSGGGGSVMKERPILFSAEMVRALLDWRKTMTRRVIKDYKIVRRSSREEFATSGPHQLSLKETPGYAYVELESGALVGLPCPYGQPGDRLWVRERHSFNDAMKSDTPHCWLVDVEYSDGTERNILAETKKPKLTRERGETGWRPSIFMPRWASRILLEITSVRVERVQEISDSDAFAEGIQTAVNEGLRGDGTARGSFRDLWDSINAARGYGWDVNPWVWVVEFRRIK
jgi:hypothetical protein